MNVTILRKVGGSTMVAVPRALLEQLNIKAGSLVGLELERGRIVIEPQSRPRYSLNELLAKCDPSSELANDREWLDSTAIGTELI